MTAAPKLETPTTEQVFGIAKKFTLELEKFPLHSHAAIVVMMKTYLEHRQIVLGNEQQEAQQRANQAAMDAAVDAHAKRQAQENARIASEMVESRAREIGKAPRMTLVSEPGKGLVPTDAVAALEGADPNQKQLAEEVTA